MVYSTMPISMILEKLGDVVIIFKYIHMKFLENADQVKICEKINLLKKQNLLHMHFLPETAHKRS